MRNSIAYAEKAHPGMIEPDGRNYHVEFFEGD